MVLKILKISFQVNTNINDDPPNIEILEKKFLFPWKSKSYTS